MQIVVAPLLIIVVLLLLFVILTFFMLVFDLFLDLPYVATDRKKIATIIKLANIKKGQTAVDLGSGDGRLLIESAKKGARAIGYEINPFLIAVTRIKAFLMSLRSRACRGRSNLKREIAPSRKAGLAMTGWEEIVVKRQNLWKADLQVADIIFVYGRKKTMQKFQDFVYQNAKKGTRIIVNTNPFPIKQPIKSENGIFLYKI